MDFFLMILLITAAMDLLLPFIYGRQYAGYHHCKDTISTLGTRISPVQKAENATLITVGLLMLLFSAGQWRVFSACGCLQIFYFTGIAVYGAGTVLAGFFPDDPAGETESVSGKVHGIGSGLGFILLILNPVWAVFMETLSRFRNVNAFFFIGAIITFVLFVLSEHQSKGWLQYTGLFQRLNLIILYSSLMFNYFVLN